MAPEEVRCSMIAEMMGSVNSGWPCRVRIWAEPTREGLEDAGTKRTIPWLGVRGVEARRWKVSGTSGTWSRCICWIVCVKLRVRC